MRICDTCFFVAKCKGYLVKGNSSLEREEGIEQAKDIKRKKEMSNRSLEVGCRKKREKKRSILLKVCNVSRLLYQRLQQ